MRVVIQRVKSATVEILSKNHSSIDQGLLIFVGIENDDGEQDINWLCKKIIQLRIFDDKNGVMNLSVADIDGEILVISQFTLHAKTKKGNRPSYIKAARPDIAIPVYNKFVEKLGFYLEKEIKTGEFGALMQISLVNDGPVTIIIDTKNKDI
ncbi:MAG: D-tyrosyl-tRNA(Tyr) deacylase [Bacteroidales bacterium]|nr:D-tyrosyl-tRNA(Tyr) deacylase [Bacteroidales bacterium]